MEVKLKEAKYKDAVCDHCGELCKVLTCQQMGEVSYCHGVGFDYIDDENKTQSVNEGLRHVSDWDE